MAKLLDSQSDDSAVVFTHFDCWFPDEEGDENRALANFDKATIEEKAAILGRVLLEWDEILKCGISPDTMAMGHASFEDFVKAVGFDNVFKLVIFNILEHGSYDVYHGVGLIEVYTDNYEGEF